MLGCRSRGSRQVIGKWLQVVDFQAGDVHMADLQVIDLQVK